MSKKVAIGVAVGVTSFLVLGAGAVGVLAYQHKDTFYPGVSISGIDLSGKTYAQAESLVNTQVKDYLQHQVTITMPDTGKPIAGSPGEFEETEVVAAVSQLGLEFDAKTALDDAWGLGHQKNQWAPRVAKAVFSGYAKSITYQVDRKQVQTFVDTEVVPKIGTPVPAFITVLGDKVTVVASKPGFSVDKLKLTESIVASLADSQENRPSFVKAPVSLVESPVTQASLQPTADRMNEIGDLNVRMTLNAQTLTPTKTQLLSWLLPVQDESGTVSLALKEDAIAAYIKTQSTADQTKSFNAVTKAITPYLSNTSTDSLEVALVAKPTAGGGPDTPTLGKYEGKYVEVNLKEQKMYLVEGSSLVKSYVVSSGKWSTPTPVGEYKIGLKSKRAYSASYGLYMPYWQSFLNNEYGLHELPEWPNGYKEGQNHLGTPVSHGCVRLGVGDAAEVYNWTETGTPVYIH